MKKIILCALILFVAMSCSKFDDSAIWKSLKEHEERISMLETLCNQLNTNILSLQTIVAALQNNDYITNVAPINSNGVQIGFTITFAKRGSITIYHGQDGKDGENGKDGSSPIIGVRQDADGTYCWTLNGEWILDSSGNKIPTSGKDGIDGTNAVTPKLKIVDDYWFVSYDNGATWEKLGKATVASGLDGIISITQDADYVYFHLSDGEVLASLKRNSTTIIFRDLSVEAICIRNWDTNHDGELSYDEAASVLSLNGVFEGNTTIVSFEELRYFTGLKEIELSSFKGCKNLWRVSLPPNIESIGSGAFYECTSLEIVQFNGNKLTKIGGGNTLVCGSSDYGSVGVFGEFNGAFAYCSSLRHIALPESLETIEDSAFAFCSSLESVDFGSNSKLKLLGGEFVTGAKAATNTAAVSGAFMNCVSLREIRIPSTVVEIGAAVFYECTALKEISFSDDSQLLKIGGGYYNRTPGYSAQYFGGAFAYCTSLETVTIPKSVKEIENAAFYGCSALATITMLPSEAPELNCLSPTYSGTKKESSYHFKETSDNLKFIVSAESAEIYKSAEVWKYNYASKIVTQ